MEGEWRSFLEKTLRLGLICLVCPLHLRDLSIDPSDHRLLLDTIFLGCQHISVSRFSSYLHAVLSVSSYGSFSASFFKTNKQTFISKLLQIYRDLLHNNVNILSTTELKILHPSIYHLSYFFPEPQKISYRHNFPLFLNTP